MANNRSSHPRLRADFDDVVTAMVGDIYMLEPNKTMLRRKYESALDVFVKGKWVWGVKSGGLNK